LREPHLRRPGKGPAALDGDKLPPRVRRREDWPYGIAARRNDIEKDGMHLKNSCNSGAAAGRSGMDSEGNDRKGLRSWERR